MNSGIYRIDLGNGWFYIGQTSNFVKRKSGHFRALESQLHSNIRMQNCWNKYQVFIFTVLHKCEISELTIQEQFFLDIYFSNPKNVIQLSCNSSAIQADCILFNAKSSRTPISQRTK